jgi:type IV secretion system protein VirB5
MKTFKIGLGLLALLITQPSMAGVPVIDGANLTQKIISINHLISQLNELKEQVVTAKSQLRKAEDTYNSIEGVRGMGSLISTAYDPTMAVSIGSILAAHGVQTGMALGLSSATAALLDESNQLAADYSGKSGKTLQQAQTRFTELSRLIAQVNASPQQKDVLDLQARIGAESVMLQNETVKLNALKAKNEADKELLRQKQRQAYIKLGGRGSIDLTAW